ncbi:hypothetical protein BD626DRAFT_534494 [Schizophyllum amplum]|uniref:Uncharacterized protein n=1 Tax=Schizophyllum amplum TaxID=97359 RepID=A0A550CUI0_9AGAR|nr:hypothetical protein BD626DRAFT_534494 [Auriculariopsis ampla]
MPDAHAQATQALEDESRYRFASFSASDAVTLGLSIRKRFRASHRHAKGKGLVIAIHTIAGHTLFACTVGDLGHVSGIGDVSLDSWACVEGLIGIVRRTGHSSFYVEKALTALGKTAKQLGLEGDERVFGGAFPIWLDNAPCCPIAIVACYSGSSQDDHQLVVTTVRDFISKLMRTGEPGRSEPVRSSMGEAGRSSMGEPIRSSMGSIAPMPAPSIAPSGGSSVPIVPIHDSHEEWPPEPQTPQGHGGYTASQHGGGYTASQHGGGYTASQHSGGSTQRGGRYAATQPSGYAPDQSSGYAHDQRSGYAQDQYSQRSGTPTYENSE